MSVSDRRVHVATARVADRPALPAQPAQLAHRFAHHLIATGGVAVGVTALIVVLGVMNGLRDDLRERILVASPHLRMLTFGAGLRMDDWQQVAADGAEASPASWRPRPR